MNRRTPSEAVPSSCSAALAAAPPLRQRAIPIDSRLAGLGFMGAPLRLSLESPGLVLAVGGELKSAICLLDGSEAWLSGPFGELSDPKAYRRFARAAKQLQDVLPAPPAVVAYDLHPDYAATRYALRSGLPTCAVQHHHAHVVSGMAEHSLDGEVLGLACDGTGFGTDGAIWGGEILRCSLADFERVGHLRYFPLIGGDSAARETWRPAAGLLVETFGRQWRNHLGAGSVEAEQARLAEVRFQRPDRLPRTSSTGRLFDAVAFLLGVCALNDHEAQAAMALEALAHESDGGSELGAAVVEESGQVVLDPRPMIRALIEMQRAGLEPADLARAFHETLAGLFANGVTAAARSSGLNRVVLTGGCFANALLLAGVNRRLRAAGLQVFAHERVSPGDAGLALGQAVVAAERLRRAGHVPCGAR